MGRKLLLPFVAFAMAGLMVACAEDVDYVELDRGWDSVDTDYMTSYEAVKTRHTTLESQLQAMVDTGNASQRAAAQAKLDAHNKALQDMEAKRADLRTRRENARNAKDRAAYDAARSEADYDAWKRELERIRAEQADVEGMVTVGAKSVGAVDVNLQDTSKPLIRVEPGKDDDKPLIEMNKNPK